MKFTIKAKGSVAVTHVIEAGDSQEAVSRFHTLSDCEQLRAFAAPRYAKSFGPVLHDLDELEWEEVEVVAPDYK